MSIGVAMDQLADTMADYRFAYLLTVTDGGRAHAVAVTPSVSGEDLLIDGVGTKSRATPRNGRRCRWSGRRSRRRATR